MGHAPGSPHSKNSRLRIAETVRTRIPIMTTAQANKASGRLRQDACPAWRRKEETGLAFQPRRCPAKRTGRPGRGEEEEMKPRQAHQGSRQDHDVDDEEPAQSHLPRRWPTF